MVDFIRETPEMIGLGLDQATAVWVQKDTLEVIGKSYVAIYDYNTIVASGGKRPFFFLSEGQRYDLAARKMIEPVGGRRAVADEEDDEDRE